MRLFRSARRPAVRVCPPTPLLRLEALEDRTLPSTSFPGFAVPGYAVFHPAGTAAPLASAGPSGYTPSQIRHAYGFDQIALPGGVQGDGTGTTIAIVDAYDDPTIVSSTDPNFLS